MHRRLEAKNAAIIGICDDADDKNDECKALIREKNLSYINLLPYEGMDELAIDSFPTSFFVDREGKIMTCPVIGVPGDISEYEKTIDSLLNHEKVSESSAQPAAETDKTDYRVIVKDESGAPVAGARVQFCDDVTCMFGKTDETGTASFAAEQGQYTVHIQKAPEGYAACTEEFAVAQDTHEVQIVLKKA